MQTTGYYGLSKPDIATDKANINVLNGNMDIIDTALHEASQSGGGQVMGEALDDSTDDYTGYALFAQGAGTLETPKYTSNVMLIHTEDSEKLVLTGDELRADNATGYFGSIITSSVDCSMGQVTGYSGYFEFELHSDTGYFDNLYVNGEPVTPGGGFDGYFPDPVYFQDTINVDNNNHSGSIKFNRTNSSQILVDFTGYHDTGYITGVNEIATLYFAGSSVNHNYIGYLDSNNIDVTGDITKTVSGTTRTYRTVEANPSGTASSTLSKVEIGGTLYDVGSSSSDHDIYPEYASSTFTGYLVMAQSDLPQTPIMSPDFYLDPSDTLILGGSLGMSVGGSIHGYSDMTCEGNMSAYTATISTLNDDMYIASGYAIYDGYNNPLVSVEANPSDTPTDDLTTISIDGTTYSVYGECNVYGAFIDTNRVIKASTAVPPNTDVTYTATEDCCVEYSLIASSNQGVQVSIDGVDMKVNYISSGVYTWGDIVYLRRGQTIKMRQSYTSADGSYIVYGLTFGTQNIFTPQIYSTEERCVGVWIDNKPLYAKSYNFGALPNNTSKTLPSGLTGVNVVKIDGSATNASGFTTTIPHPEVGGNADVQIDFLATNEIRIKTNSDYSGFTGYVTLYYTKTTDTAGSGSYNTLGVPMVHRDDTEKVVGTWFGDTLYEKSYHMSSISSTYTIVDTSINCNTAKIRECVMGSVVVGGGYNNAQYAEGHLSYNTFVRIMLQPAGLNVGIESPPSDPTSDFDFTIRYTKVSS